MQFPSDPQVLSSLISAVGSILSASIAATCAALIGKKFADRLRLQQQLIQAANDILFLLDVERVHVERQKSFHDESTKLEVREVVKDSGLNWSGNFVASRCRSLIDRLS